MHVSSSFNAVSLRQEPSPLLIGERLNILGSRRTKGMALDGDYGGLVEVARQQSADGAHCLDVCMASNDIDERETLLKLVKMLGADIEAPLVIDSTDPVLIAEAVRMTPGRPIINSINLESSERFDGIAPIMARYGAPAVAMCIGPDGMARTAKDKLKVAEMMYERGKKWGIREEQYLFDVLVFPATTGTEREAVRETLEGIRLIKERFPKSGTVLGISNVSMSLKPYARKRVNSIFLYHAVKAGLDAAIVDVAGIIPYHTIPEDTAKVVEDVLFDRHPDALERMEDHFAGRTEDQSRKPEVDPSWDPAERARFRIVNQLPRGIEADVREAILRRGGDHAAAISVLNDSLLPAMKKVGDMFGSGDIILASVLKSAECMKAATAELEKYLDKKEGASKGTIVLGTVYGDVHDIGKNLVKTILQNNGFTVHDLGKQVPMQSFLDAIEKHDADAVGLSALLVATSKQMKFFVEHARNNGMDLPILCGGAAINSNYINRIAKEDSLYDKAFYCNNMFDGLDIMESLVKDRESTISKRRVQLESWKEKKYSRIKKVESSIVPVASSPVPAAAGMSIRRLKPDVSEIWPRLDLDELFKHQWGVRGRAAKGNEEKHHTILAQQKRLAADLFEPRVTYGFFECSSDGNALLVGDRAFEFPRSDSGLCLADYFGKKDVVAFQAVTVGDRVSKVLEAMDKQGRYTDYYYLHGLAAMSAEALAVYANERINADWGIPKSLRYSWGYSSCPDLNQHFDVWELLKPEGMSLTEAGQIVPEQSTAAIVVHHPDAKYFTT